MSESVQISEELYETLDSYRRDDETMEEALRRLVSGPRPEAVAGIISSETAAQMRERLAGKDERDANARRRLQERFE